MLALKPWEFAELTIAEFDQLVQGAVERQEAEMERLAWAVVHLMNATGNFPGGKRVTMNKLLGPAYTKRNIDRAMKRKEREQD